MVPTPGRRPDQFWMMMKINNPLNNQKDGKKTFFPTIGSSIPRKPETTDSTMI